jgi:hypothetical protein
MAINPSETWQEALERWIDASSQQRVAKHLGYSPAAICQFRQGTYPGDSDYIQELIEQHLVGKECTLPKALTRGHRHQKARQNVVARPRATKPWKKPKNRPSPSHYDGEHVTNPTIELHVQRLLQQREGGETEVPCPAGYVDLLTHSEVIEIKRAVAWKEAIKVLVYAQYFPAHKPRIHLFDNHSLTYETHRTIVQGCSDLGVRVTWEDTFSHFTEVYEPS